MPGDILELVDDTLMKKRQSPIPQELLIHSVERASQIINDTEGAASDPLSLPLIPLDHTVLGRGSNSI